jgi:hypothetical protein
MSFEESNQKRVQVRSSGQKDLIKQQDATAITRRQVNTPGYGDSMSSLAYMNAIGRKDPTRAKIVSAKRLKFVSAGDEF